MIISVFNLVLLTFALHLQTHTDALYILQSADGAVWSRIPPSTPPPPCTPTPAMYPHPCHVPPLCPCTSSTVRSAGLPLSVLRAALFHPLTPLGEQTWSDVGDLWLPFSAELSPGGRGGCLLLNHATPNQTLLHIQI